MSSITIQIGAVSITIADALALYRERMAVYAATLSEDAHVEAVALWNAIQFADKRAKGIPCRLVTSARQAAAADRIAFVLGAPGRREAA
ncbi:MAG TPA: hypothetical protein VN806_13020 [Caulobacteraceae bacterium]|nr:hypothetical protein [Caulobacteraceae bacterium]